MSFWGILFYNKILFHHYFISYRVIIVLLEAFEFRFQFLGDLFRTRLSEEVVHFARIFLEVEQFP